MRWIWTVRDDNGNFPNVGMGHRGLIVGSRNKVARIAIDICCNYEHRDVRMQGWLPDNFYKNPEPDCEFVTTYGRSKVEVTKTPPFTVTVKQLAALTALDPAAPNWLRD